MKCWSIYTTVITLGGSSQDRATIQSVTRRQEGHRVEIRVTYEAEDSERYVLEALRQKGVDTIIAAGGDGMVNQVKFSPEHALAQKRFVKRC